MRTRLLLLAAAVAAFGGSLVAGFHLDDYAIFSESLRTALRGPGPLTHLTLWANYQIAGQEPLVYHAVNLLLHLGAVLLAYECFRRLLPGNASWIAAAIFAVHPLQTEAVDYVSARGIVLASILCFAALLAWLDGWVWIAVVVYAAALAADVGAVAMLIAVFAVAFGDWKERRKQIALGLMAALTVAAAVVFHSGTSASALPAWRFLRLSIIPWGFTVYPVGHEPLWLNPLLTIAVGLALGWSIRSYKSQSLLAWLLVAVAMRLVSVGPNPAADSHGYLAMFAFSAAAAILLAKTPERAVAVTVIAILGLISVSRTYVWMSEERLWREAVRRAPDAVEPKIQLAKQLRASDALEVLAQARVQAPYNPEIPSTAGKILLDEQQYDGAVDELSRAVAMNPKNAEAFNNRGVALAGLGQIPAAQIDFEHALSIDPNLQEARENLKRLTGQ